MENPYTGIAVFAFGLGLFLAAMFSFCFDLTAYAPPLIKGGGVLVIVGALLVVQEGRANAASE